ncbi:MAG: NAD(P)H-dependent oxidoreductase [Bacteroidota bacterium]
MPTRIILYASARADGNTAVIASYLGEVLQAPTLDVSARSIAPFSYENDYPETDAYFTTLQEILPFDEWLLLTPVYWYTMSAQMKAFIDRFSDVLRYYPELRPAITGKGMWAICCSSTAEHIPHFFTPFRLTADYLGMDYKGELHTWGGRVQELKPAVKELIDEFLREQQLVK